MNLPAQRRTEPSPAATVTPGTVVWVSHSSPLLAAEVVSMLRSLDLNAKLWDEAQASDGPQAACELVVADPAGLRVIATCMSGARTLRPHEDADPAPRGGLAPGVLRRVVDHIERHLGERVEIGALAMLAGLSDCHFSRAFRQSVGMPPHRYVMSRRIAVGAGLLKRTTRPMTEVALSVGFADHSHFTRMFVRMTGETPSAFRRRHR